MALHSFLSFVQLPPSFLSHPRHLHTILPTHPPLTSVINTLLAIRYSYIFSTCPNHHNILWSALLTNSAFYTSSPMHLLIPNSIHSCLPKDLVSWRSPGLRVLHDRGCTSGDGFEVLSCPFWSTVVQCSARLPIHPETTGPHSQWCQFFLTGGVGLSVTLHIVDLWQYYICCTRSGVTRCPLFLVLYLFGLVRVRCGALIEHQYTYESPHCITSQYSTTFIPVSVPLWNDLGDPLFDGVGLMGLA